MKIKMIAALLAAAMLCGCSNNSREAELQSEIDELKSQVEDLNEKSSSDSGSVIDDPDKQEPPSDIGIPSLINSAYDGIDWDNIPEAPASDFGYRVFYGEPAQDQDQMAWFSGDSSMFVKSIYIFDYYGHDKYVKIPNEIDGLPVTVMGSGTSGEGYYTKPWDRESEWVDVQWDESVFRDTNVEYVFIPEHLRSIFCRAFDDCPTLKSISVDPNNLAYFSEDGVLFEDVGVVRGTAYSFKMYVYTKLPKYTYTLSDSGRVESFDIQDEGEWEMKTPDYAFENCYIDRSLSKLALYRYDNVIKFTDGTYGVEDQVTGKYIPIEAGQFKRNIWQMLFRYPEGKRDKSYTVKKRICMRVVGVDGNEEFQDGYDPFYTQTTGITLAFDNVKYLEKMEFEDGIVSFYNAIVKYGNSDIPIGVEKVVIPASLVSLGSVARAEGYSGNMFGGLTNLKEYEVAKNNRVFKSVDGALLSKDGKILYSMPCKIGKRYTVPDGVKIIAPSAFINAQDMTITIPASVKYLGINSLEELSKSSASEIKRSSSIFGNSSDITLNVSSKTEIRDIFEALPEECESELWSLCPGLTVNFVD